MRTFKAYVVNIILLAMTYAAILTQFDGLANIVIAIQWLLGLASLCYLNRTVCIALVADFYKKQPSGKFHVISPSIHSLFFFATIVPLVYFGWWFTTVAAVLRMMGVAHIIKIHAEERASMDAEANE